MFTVIGFMLGGMCIGYLLRRKSLSWIQEFITVLIWLLLFILGIEVGGNRRIIDGLGTIGFEALIMTVSFVVGSCVFAWMLWYILYKRKEGKV
jgi:uncharacterized membrane protein YbjE (DUF340 family)